MGAHGDWAPEQRKELRVKLKSKPTNHYSINSCMIYLIYHIVACQGLNEKKLFFFKFYRHSISTRTRIHEPDEYQSKTQ